MKVFVIVLFFVSLAGHASAASKPPQLWSHHKQMKISAEACSAKGHRALKVLGFASVVKNGNYVYGNYLGNRAAVKCASLDKGSFLYLAVAGPDKDIVEKLRNEISKKFKPSSDANGTNTDIDKFIPFSENEIAMIDKGYQLFLSGIFSGQFNGGFYTDPNKETQVFDFWSNGKWAKYDRMGKGHHATIFELSFSKLIYVGSIGKKGTFIDVGTEYKRFLDKPAAAWHKYQRENSKKPSSTSRAKEV